jgi:MFS superfamily sulfate permease-like transporter
VKLTPKRALIAVLILGLALVVVAAIVSSTPLYVTGGLIACAAFGLACICSDHNEFGR